MQIKIQQFSGPLDLLLQLIERQEMDVTQIAIASVTEQFLAHLKKIEILEPTALADYLAMAAKLLVIKSKSILPTLELDAEEQEIAVDLQSRLLLYKQFKEAAAYLRKLDNARRQSFNREIGFEDRITFFPDPEVTAETLRAAITSILKSLEELAGLPGSTIQEAISIQEKIDALQLLISKQIETKLGDLLAQAKDKTEIIVTFLALLELIKQRVLSVEQEQMFSEIIIRSNNIQAAN